jgi:alpha-galactosidase
VSAKGPVEIWSRSLSDGSKAVGIFNRHPGTMSATVDFRELGFSKPPTVRDIWQAKDLGRMQNIYTVQVPGHGVVLLKVSK